MHKKNNIVGAYTTFGKLKKVIVGNFYTKDYFDCIPDQPFRERMQVIAGETLEDLNGLIDTIRSYDVDVYQLENHFNQPGVYHNGKIGIINPRPPYTPRDNIDFIDNKMFSLFNWQQPARFFDDYAHHDLFRQWNKQGAEWHQMPKGWHDEDLRDERFLLQNEFPGEQQPYLDSSNFLKVGNRLFYTTYWTSNNLGAEWMQNILGDRIEMIDVTDSTRFVNHIDCLLKIVRPGLAISMFHKDHIIKRIPLMANWEIIQIPRENSIDRMNDYFAEANTKGGFAFYNDADSWSKKWLDQWGDDDVMNTHFDIDCLSIDENTMIVSEGNTEYERLMKKYGVTLHPIKFRHQFFWGNGINCVCADVKREDELIDYFK